MERPISQLTIKDIDAAMVRYYNKIVDVHVDTPGGTGDSQFKVPVVFAGSERYHLSKKSEYLDSEGKIILPAIAIRRESIDRTPGVNALGAEQPYLFVSRRVDDKTGIVQKNWYNQRTAEGNKKDYKGAVYETLTIPYPETFTVHYKIIVWSSFIEQANEIVETFWHSLDYGLNFKFPVKNLGDEVDPDTKEPSKVYMVGHVQPDHMHEHNFEDFGRDERIIKYSFEVVVYASTYTFPKSTGMSYGKDEKGKKMVERQYSPYKVVLKFEDKDGENIK